MMQKQGKICCFSGQENTWKNEDKKKEFFELLYYATEFYILRGVSLFCVDSKNQNQQFISIVNLLKKKYPFLSLGVADRKSFRDLLKNAEAFIAVWDCNERRIYKNIRFAEKRNVYVDYLLLPIKNKCPFTKYAHLYIEYPLSLSARIEKDRALEKLKTRL